MKTEFSYPTDEELYAYERIARRERAKAQAALVRALFRATREALFPRTGAGRAAPKAVLHG